MSDSEHSTVTYTSVSIPVEDDSDMGSPGVDGPPSPDYTCYPEYIPPEDDFFLAEEQPLPAATSPTADSPGYIPESDPKRDPKEDDEEDPEEDPGNYPADRRDDDDDDDEEEEEEDEEEEEHLASADYTVVALPAVDHVPSEEETEPFETDECAATPPSPLIPYSSPLPQIPSPPLPIPSPPPNSPSHIKVLESCLPLSKRLHFATPILNHEVEESLAAGATRQDGPVVAREDPYSAARGDLYRFFDRVDVAPGRPMSRELDYGITDTWDDLVGSIKEITSTTLEGTQMVEFQRQHGPAKGPAQPDAPGEAATQYRSFVQKIAPKRRTTRLNPGATPTPVTNTHTTTSVTNVQLQAMIDEGVTVALAALDATRNGNDSHLGTGAKKACASYS
ncbi:hypothetical protein Tco_1457345 [Tanacetum coccineum]